MSKRRRRNQAPTAPAAVIEDPRQIANDLALSRAELEFAKDIIANRHANGLAGAIGYTDGSAPTFRSQEPVSSANTLFKNLRYYLVSNFRQVLSQAYAEIGLVRTICAVPVDDAFRGGIELKSKIMEETALKELADSVRSNGDLRRAKMGAVWDRLYGGGGIIVWVSDQDPSKPLNFDAIGPKTDLRFIDADLWELFYDQWNVDGMNPTLPPSFTHFNYYGEKVHRSRVLMLKGIEAPSWLRPRLRGWGLSVVEQLVRSMNQYLKATDLGFQVLDEFKLDIYKIKNLNMSILSPTGTDAIYKRVQLGNWQKNYQNAIVMDADDDFDNKQLSFAGLAEAMMGIRLQVAADMRIPMLKLFGTPAQGLNANDENTLEVYNSMVESEVREPLDQPIMQMTKLRAKQMYGEVPNDLYANWRPLRVLNAEQHENVKTQKFNRLNSALQSGSITMQEFRDACNKGELFDITLDNSSGVIEVLEDERDAKQDQDASGERKENSLEPYTISQRVDRVRAANSADFDKASYEADGGDAWIDPRRQPLFENPDNVDKTLWERAKQASRSALGAERWQFVTWWYQKQGGKFS